MSNDTSTSTDKIEKKITLRASRARVWRAISDSVELGTWFGMKIDGPFVAGKSIRGTITPTKVDPEVAKMQQPHAGALVELHIEKVDAEREFSFRWHPYALEKDVDYKTEPATLVSFVLSDAPNAPNGVLLTITESGFDRIPLERRAKAFAANEGGWQKQTELIEKYLAQNA
jgi:uncharacterized protein YndB with AHSA1/START domain